MDTIRVLLADDHPVVRAGLSAVLDSDPTIEIVGSVNTADAAVEAVKEQPCDIDVVLMDLRFGESPTAHHCAAGVSATKEICALEHPPQVLVVTNYSTDSDMLGAISAGAVGYLLKDANPEELINGVHAAARGETVLSSNVAQRLMGRLQSPSLSLSDRELEVLTLVSRGLSNRGIAAELFLTEATVKSHLVHVFSKLNVNSRTSAVAKARELGML
ncbi:response regulator transcription factor [Corynebacterium sp. H78]|uniref:response regulator transcription factor n=1 Tax=Corynebacterium sp. H78 TaxID=3133417 RepID=UPI0030AB11C8